MKKPDLLIHFDREDFTAQEGRQLREEWERFYPSVDMAIIYGDGLRFLGLCSDGGDYDLLPILDGDAVVAYLDNLGRG